MYKQILYSIKRINYGFDKTFYFVLIFATSILLISCGNQRNSENNKVEETANENDTSITIESNSDTTNKALLKLISGIYHGVQEEYNMKNKFGDDVIIAGKSITVPRTDHKIIIGADKSIEIQQTSLADNSRYYMNGTYKVIAQTDSILELSCHLTDEPKSNIEYTIKINVLTFTAKCMGFKQPDFEVKREITQ